MTAQRQTFGDRMAVLKNARHEKFAQAIAQGKTQEEAHRVAGYKPNPSNASTINRNEQVRNRVATLQASAAAAIEFTLQDMLAQVDEDRRFARELQQPAAASSSSALKAKLLGMLVDKVESSNKNQDVTDRPQTEQEALASLKAVAASNGLTIQ